MPNMAQEGTTTAWTSVGSHTHNDVLLKRDNVVDAEKNFVD
jgi:hypothetical protein